MDIRLEPFDVLGFHYKNEQLKSVLRTITGNSLLNRKPVFKQISYKIHLLKTLVDCSLRTAALEILLQDALLPLLKIWQLSDSTPLARPERTEQHSTADTLAKSG